MPEYEVSTRQTTLQAEVQQADPEWSEIPWAWEFSNGRRFDSTDHTDAGIYDGT